ncbi:MAG: translation initiation factor IF-1 [Patescibacteria group bacterium]|nr:MAG: translation initiation factor IF-1 [Patescibacteria group bacterium]
MNGSKEKTYILEGIVIEVMPNTLFKVKIQNPDNKEDENSDNKEDESRVVICYLSGKMRKNFIRVMPGDKVRVEFSPYDRKRGRIISRI